MSLIRTAQLCALLTLAIAWRDSTRVNAAEPTHAPTLERYESPPVIGTRRNAALAG